MAIEMEKIEPTKFTEIRRKTGRCRNGYERDGGTIWHLTQGEGFKPSFCGLKPGQKGNGWSVHSGNKVNCQKCLFRLAKLRRGKLLSGGK